MTSLKSFFLRPCRSVNVNSNALLLAGAMLLLLGACKRAPPPESDPMRTKSLDQAAAAPEQTDEELRSKRIVFVVGPLSEGSANIVIAKMLFLEHEDAARPLTLAIDSGGGELISAIAIRDTIRQLKPSVKTTCRGRAFGGAALLLASGARGSRTAASACQVGFGVLTGATPLVHRELVEGYSATTGQTAATIEADLIRSARWSAKEALAYGLIDRVDD